MYNQNQYPFWFSPQMYYMYPYPFWINPQMYSMYMKNYSNNQQSNIFNYNTMPMNLTDYGPELFAIDINGATERNNTFRTALWTGEDLQVTLMSINVGDDIGLEVHETGDQFIRIEQGQGIVVMGDSKNNLNFQQRIYDGFAIMIPVGKWHNIINTGNQPLKLYAIYAPPQHPSGTVHQTKADAQASEH